MASDIILLAHGDGGKLTHDLVTELFMKHLGNGLLEGLTDAATFKVGEGRMALTTDSFVIDPPFFPGGDIGKLAVCGTVNDLAVSGAVPRYLTAGFLIEEGLPMADLERVVASMAETCREAGVQVVAGDTKVVPRGGLDRIFINTTGFGLIPDGVDLGYHRIAPGDMVLVNGNMGDHGMAVLTAREGFGFEQPILSDCAPLHEITGLLAEKLSGMKLMRDLTRGGLATSTKEIASSAVCDIWLEEAAIPVDPVVKGASEMLGVDPFYMANEGKFLAIVAPEQADEALRMMREHRYGRNARVVGEVRTGKGDCYLKTALGGTKYLDMLAGAPLPRIC
ncbi:MAG: hydrogenase expression/formation protein HypE [Eubacteriales bacterium]|nr:hydrogenase expression/formation protein HypE [Clostridia bacterium]MDZ4043273.1 hydrogenase expression/formation protein HypE [Eubacteriales bacterium]MDZ7611098.1 hydrogenase expression/formation protein HypE [Eubacteriales bacterium]